MAVSHQLNTSSEGIYPFYADTSGPLSQTAYTTLDEVDFEPLVPGLQKEDSYFIDNFISSKKGYELLWMNLACCCSSKLPSSSKSDFGSKCNNVSSCVNTENDWWGGE